MAVIPVTDQNNDQKKRNGRYARRDSHLSNSGNELDSSQLPEQNQKSDIDLFTILAEPRRRRIVFCLAMSKDHQMTTTQLGSHIRSIEDGANPLDVDRSDATTTRHSIKRHHIQKLESLDIVDIDREIVRAGEQFGTALYALCFVESRQI